MLKFIHTCDLNELDRVINSHVKSIGPPKVMNTWSGLFWTCSFSSVGSRFKHLLCQRQPQMMTCMSTMFPLGDEGVGCWWGKELWVSQARFGLVYGNWCWCPLIISALLHTFWQHERVSVHAEAWQLHLMWRNLLLPALYHEASRSS